MKIFLGHSFTNLIENGKVKTKYQDRILKIIDLVKQKGHKISCALIREEFGKKLMSSKECTPFDFKEIKDCDLFFCFPGSSGGVHIELGWASALSKDIVILLNKEKIYSPLVKGLVCLTNVRIIEYDNDELFEKINGVLKCL